MSGLGSLGAAIGGMGGGVVGGAVVRLFLDDKQFQSALAKSEMQTKTSTGRMASFGSAATTALGLVGTAFVGMALKGAESLMRIEQINAQTVAAVKSTGGAANISAEQVGMLSSKIEHLTSVEAETVQEGANLLLTFTKVRNEVGAGNDIFNQATAIMTDMSVALGQDMKSSAIQLGKALNDPIRGITALRRVGVSFSTQQEKQIKNMVKQNDLMGAQKVVLAELNKEFGKSAEALGDTTAGKVKRFQQAWGGAMEDVAAGLIDLSDAIRNPTEFFGSLGDNSKIAADAMRQLRLAVEGNIISVAQAEQVIGQFAKGGIVSANTANIFAASLYAVGQEASHVTPHIHDVGHLADLARRKLGSFAGKTEAELVDWRKGATTSLNFVGASFEDLIGSSHRSATGILRNMRRALKSQQEFAKNSTGFLAEVREDFGPKMQSAAAEMVSILAESGQQGADEMKALRGASDKQIREMLTIFARGRTQADRTATRVIDLGRVVERLPASKTIDINVRVNASGSGTTVSDRNIADALARELIRQQTP